jgi:hypothetical protein
MTDNKLKLTQILNCKHKNNPGFFDGIVDVINEFSLYDFYRLHTFKEEVIRFLKAYHIVGLSIEPNGELSEVVYPFQQSNDILLALYAVAQYFK